MKFNHMYIRALLSAGLLAFSATAWAGNPHLSSTPADLGLTFNTGNCGVGQQVIAGNGASTLQDGGSSSTYIIQVVEPDGGTTQTISGPHAPFPVVNIAANSLSFTNTVAHTTGSVLQVRLLCEPSPANTAASTCGTRLDSQINNSVGTAYPNELIASMTYTACPPPSVSASVDNNWLTALLIGFMTLLGGILLFRKQQA